ncbi:MAG: hypothetical protein HY084_12745 [Gemmatimonadetes bacterium]|nr:hypothetical protein [Gemmatimonadota bacterium]
MFPTTSKARVVMAAVLAVLPGTLRAQHLAPVDVAERCHGERIVEITLHGSQRDVMDRVGGLGDTVNRGIKWIQPRTADHVIRGFLLLKIGDSCDEARRYASERVLRSQPFISDVAIRVQRVGDGEVRLVVETIDEYVVRVEGWGLEGVPVGAEVGSANLFGGARELSATLEYGRGGAIGRGGKFADRQLFGLPIILSTYWASRPLSRYSGIALSRPILTEYDPFAWLVEADMSRFYYTFHETSIRDVSIEYDERNWVVGGLRRDANRVNGPFFGAAVAGTYTDPIRTIAIRQNGPEPVSAPELMARYHPFTALRVGASTGYRALHFLPVAGLGDLTAVQDVPLGWQLTGIALQGLGVFPGMPPDMIGVLNGTTGVGNASFLLRSGFELEVRRPGTVGEPVSTLGSAHVVATAKTSLRHTTMLDVEWAGGANARLPMQLTFRDDEGLLGYRSSDVGGGHRTIWRFEDRWLIPSPTEKAELAVAPIVQAGKIDAGDALYGVTTPWRYGAGVAFMAAIPKGSKHMVRLEFGWPVNPPGVRQMEFRISYGDRTSAYDGIPGAILGAREAEAAARALTP